MKAYESIGDELKELVAANKKIGYDSKKCNSALISLLKKNGVNKDGIIELIKANKTAVE